MERRFRSVQSFAGIKIVLVLLLASASVVRAGETPRDERSANALWRHSVDQAGRGEFTEAAQTLRRLETGTHLTKQVLGWLESYEGKQRARREMDREDYEKYVRYANERIERQEYNLALEKALSALDVAADRDAFLQLDWLRDLADKSLTQAQKFRGDREWRKAWQIYARLDSLFEREPRYRKLEREVQTLWRLDTMFEEDNEWEEQLEKVRWDDAERALEYVGTHYVIPADFKAICEHGLEQLLILADSKSAQEVFEGLGNEQDRADFKARIGAKLARVQENVSLDQKECVRHFRRVIGRINKQTVRLPEPLLVSELMRGALHPLDDYTTVIWPTHTEEFDKHTRGDFVGVGISIMKSRLTDEIEVVTPLEDSPAYRAGVQAGDIIASVDGVEIKDFSINKVVRTITGPKGSEVTLSIRRGEDMIEFLLERDLIKIVSVKGLHRDPDHEERWEHWLDKENGIAYVRLTNFQRNTPEDLENLLSKLEAEGLEGLVLDLRGNPGGLLDSACKIASMFLTRGDTIVSTKGRDPSENNEFLSPCDGPFCDKPLVVLTDGGSASASEIVAGAVRDNKRGQIVGERTFGKFSVQNLIRLGRSSAKLKITTAKYFLPSGDSLHREPGAETWGVEPYIPVRLALKERINIMQMRRDSQILGPKKEVSEGATADEEKSGEEKPGEEKSNDDVAENEEPTTDKAESPDEAVADGEPEESKLPPLEQLDPNERPKEDAQLDTALLLLRIQRLSNAHPTLATADAEAGEKIGQPKIGRP